MLSYDMEARDSYSLYEYLYHCIRSDIIDGSLAPDEHLPSKRALAEHLDVSVITVENAYAQLIAEGYVYARPRRGYYVSTLPERDDGPRAASRSFRQSVSDEPDDRHLIADFSHPSLRPDASAAALWGRALRGALAQESQEELFAQQPPQGARRLREAIASYLHNSRGMDVDPSCIVVGAGAQMLYSTIALLMGSGGVVALEDPGYPRLHEIYRAHGLACVPVALDEEGICVRGIEASAATLAHIMPSHQFPTGRVTSIARRYELLSWVTRADARFLVEDDYDWEFRMAGRPIPTLVSIDTTGRVIYVSTFSKSLSSALRIAFAVLPPSLIGDYHVHAGFYASTVSSVDQIALARILESGEYERHLNRYRTQSRRVRDALVAGLRASALAGRMCIEEEDSGLHFVLALQAEHSESEIAAAALEDGVRLAPLSAYAVDTADAQRDDGLRRFVMQYDGLDPSHIDKVIAVLERAAG